MRLSEKIDLPFLEVLRGALCRQDAKAAVAPLWHQMFWVLRTQWKAFTMNLKGHSTSFIHQDQSTHHGECCEISRIRFSGFAGALQSMRKEVTHTRNRTTCYRHQTVCSG